MPRAPVDDRKRRKALRILDHIVQGLEDKAANLSRLEDEFVRSIGPWVEKSGSAFADPAKSTPDEPLSRRQQQTRKDVRDKARGNKPPSAPGGGLKGRTQCAAADLARQAKRPETPPVRPPPPTDLSGPAF